MGPRLPIRAAGPARPAGHVLKGWCVGPELVAGPIVHEETVRRSSVARRMEDRLDSALRQLLGNSTCVVAGLAEAGSGSATPATNSLPSEAKRVLPSGLHEAGPATTKKRGARNGSGRLEDFLLPSPPKRRWARVGYGWFSGGFSDWLSLLAASSRMSPRFIMSVPLLWRLSIS